MVQESSDMLKGQRSSALRWSWPKLRDKTVYPVQQEGIFGASCRYRLVDLTGECEVLF